MKVAALEVCDRTRVRSQTPKSASDVVQEYADAYRCGLLGEPLDVFNEKGTERYIVADGEHRLLALRAAKVVEVDVRMHAGDEVAALDFAIGCNQSHGLRRTKADRFHAFTRIMETPALKDKYRTDTELADKIGVAIRTVKDYKVDWRNSESGDQEARRAKEQSRRSATKNTKNGHAARTEITKPKKSDEPPKAVKERAEPSKPTWTTEDEHGYKLLKSAWQKATMAAREKHRGEICG